MRITLFIILVSVMMASGSGLSQDQINKAQRNATSREKQEAAIKRNGGLVEVPTTGGVVRVVNKQSLIAVSKLKEIVSEIGSNIGMTIDVTSELPADGKTTVVLNLLESGDAPSLLIAPEDKWASVNVSRLYADKPSTRLLALRLHKEIWRALAMAMGASNSNYKPSVMHNVYSLKDLDDDPAIAPCPEVFDKMQSTALQLGIHRRRFVSYKRACKEGWAPAPTNDLQKAIWEQVKADKERGPTNPIEIPMPEKK